MFLAAYGGAPPQHPAWADEEEVGAGSLGASAYLVQAVNRPMQALLRSAAVAQEGAMQYKTIQVLNTLG
jgi:hypothetical protein